MKDELNCVQKLVAQLADDSVNQKLKVVCLKILEGMITFANAGNQQGEDEERKVRDIQNKLAGLGVLEQAIERCGDHDEKIACFAAELVCSLLSGGNQELQSSMLQYFRSHLDSRFFSIVRERLFVYANKLKNRRRENEAHLRRTKISSLEYVNS